MHGTASGAMCCIGEIAHGPGTAAWNPTQRVSDRLELRLAAYVTLEAIRHRQTILISSRFLVSKQDGAVRLQGNGEAVLARDGLPPAWPRSCPALPA